MNAFAADVFDRFRNPFIKHQLSSIALNSVSKFKVRVLPSLLSYQKQFNKLPLHLTFAFACLIRFYKGEWKGKELPVQDDEVIVATFQKIWELENMDEIAEQILQKAEFWGENLTTVPELKETISLALNSIETKGIEEGFKDFQKNVGIPQER